MKIPLFSFPSLFGVGKFVQQDAPALEFCFLEERNCDFLSHFIFLGWKERGNNHKPTQIENPMSWEYVRSLKFLAFPWPRERYKEAIEKEVIWMVEGHGQIQRAKIRQSQYYNDAQVSTTLPSSLQSSLASINRRKKIIRSEPWDYVCSLILFLNC